MANVGDALEALRSLQTWRENTHRNKTIVRAIFPLHLAWILPYGLEESGFEWYIKWGILHVNESTTEGIERWVRYPSNESDKLGDHPGIELKHPICQIDVDHAVAVDSIDAYRCNRRGIDYTRFPRSCPLDE